MSNQFRDYTRRLARHQLSERERDEKLRLRIAGFNSSPFRQEEIRRREEEARRREQVEQERIAEQRRQEQRKERQRREEQIRHGARVASLESQWAQLSRGAAHVQLQQMRRAFVQHYENTFNEIAIYFNPPPLKEPEIIYVEPDEDVGALSFIKPVRWR